MTSTNIRSTLYSQVEGILANTNLEGLLEYFVLIETLFLICALFSFLGYDKLYSLSSEPSHLLSNDRAHTSYSISAP